MAGISLTATLLWIQWVATEERGKGVRGQGRVAGDEKGMWPALKGRGRQLIVRCTIIVRCTNAATYILEDVSRCEYESRMVQWLGLLRCLSKSRQGRGQGNPGRINAMRWATACLDGTEVEKTRS